MAQVKIDDALIKVVLDVDEAEGRVRELEQGRDELKEAARRDKEEKRRQKEAERVSQGALERASRLGGITAAGLAGAAVGRAEGFLRGTRPVLGGLAATGILALLVQNIEVFTPVFREIILDFFRRGLFPEVPGFDAMVQANVERVFSPMLRAGEKIEELFGRLSAGVETAQEGLEFARQSSLLGLVPDAAHIGHFLSASYKWNEAQAQMRRFGRHESRKAVGDWFGQIVKRLLQ